MRDQLKMRQSKFRSGSATVTRGTIGLRWRGCIVYYHFFRDYLMLTDITLWQTVASSGGSAVVWIVIIAILLFIGLAIFVSQNYLVNMYVFQIVYDPGSSKHLKFVITYI